MKLYELGKMETAKVVKMDCGEEYNERFKNYGFSEGSIFTVTDKMENNSCVVSCDGKMIAVTMQFGVNIEVERV